MRKVFALLLCVTMAACTLFGCAPTAAPADDGNPPAEGNAAATPAPGIYTPGVYEASANGFGGAIRLSVEVDENQILSVTVLENAETAGIGSNAIESLPEKFAAANSADVDGVAGATISSNAMKEALQDALNDAMGVTPGDADMADGTYTGAGPAYGGDVKLSVSVAGNKITSIEVVESTDTPMIGGEAYKLLIESAIAEQSLAIDGISGATVSTNGFMAALSDALAQSGADIAALKARAVEKRAAETAEYGTDVLVIGAGISGLTAAIEAADNGANVILIEKLGVLGGSTTRSEGYVMGAGTEFQRQNGVEDSVEAFYEDIYSVYQIEPKLDAELLQYAIYQSTGLIDFLQDNGVEFGKLVAVSTFEPRATPRNHCSVGKGGGLTGALLESVRSKGVTVMMNTAATEILTENGAVTGAKATNQYGDDVTFRAAATILCAGSYGGSTEMMAELNPGINAELIKGCGDGDGFTLAQDAGANMILLDYPQLQYYFFWNGVPDLPVYPASAIRPVHNVLLTDGNGERVANESDFNFEHVEKVYYSGQQEGYCIVGKAFYEQYPEVCEAGLGKNFPARGDGIAFTAGTVEELAAWAGLDPATLAGTVNRYNELCDLGEDLDFGKSGEAMERIDAPYYILKLPAIVTDGYSGCQINENAQVIGADGQPIPGFYAAGACAVPELSCVNYYGCGTSLLYGGVFGRAAARHAVGELGR